MDQTRHHKLGQVVVQEPQDTFQLLQSMHLPQLLQVQSELVDLAQEQLLLVMQGPTQQSHGIVTR